MTATPRITAIAPWYGSKRTLAPRIVAELGDHSAYWEPFCGSMAVLLVKPVCRLETVNDLHADLINLARVVQDRELSAELYHRARFLWCSDVELTEADAIIRKTEAGDGPNVERALRYLITSWMGRNGECGLASHERAKSLCVRWTNNGGAPAVRWHAAVRSIAAWHRRLCKVTVLRRDGFEVLEKIAKSDEARAAIYLDPPYLEKSDTYVHDFDGDDHQRLALIARRLKRARIVVSYYDHPRLAELYPGWTKVDCSRVKNLGNIAEGKPKSLAPEVLLINGPSLTSDGGLFA